jgi:predicted AAA+ superfamily ATPase
MFHKFFDKYFSALKKNKNNTLFKQTVLSYDLKQLLNFACHYHLSISSKATHLITIYSKSFPFMLNEREWELPIQNSRIVTVTGIRRCGKSSLLGLAVNKLLQAGVSNERILFVGFDDERLIGLKAEHLDEILQSYREMYPTIHLKDVYMFFDEIQLVE